MMRTLVIGALIVSVLVVLQKSRQPDGIDGFTAAANTLKGAGSTVGDMFRAVSGTG